MKLYENESYRKENHTVVTSCENADGKILLQLQDTIFFPEEGGQYADTGYLIADGKKVRLLDGQLKNGEIFYQAEEEIAAGTEVDCVLDWEMRYMRMQQHSGEHILTGVIHNKYGYNNVGFHLSDDSPVTLDLDGTLTAEQIAEAELTANRAVYANLPVTASYPTKEELKTMDYRSKIEIEGQVRLITVGDAEQTVDVCACCAPHVARTGEIGLIKVISAQKYKGGIRLNILCGERAFRYFQEQSDIVSALARKFSTSMDKVAGCVDGQTAEIAALKQQVAELTAQQLAAQIAALPEGKHACLFADGTLAAAAMKDSFNAMAERFSGYVGVFAGNDESGYRFNAGSVALDSRELMKKMKETLDAKGGGSAEMVQGKTAAKRAEIEAFFARLEDK